ncbi:hypothetical protein Plhal304r1_c022g0077341 [Plasmopara halstedii]
MPHGQCYLSCCVVASISKCHSSTLQTRCYRMKRYRLARRRCTQTCACSLTSEQHRNHE